MHDTVSDSADHASVKLYVLIK